MLMMRLQRIGRRNEAHYRIVVIEKTQGPKSQKYIDVIGSYNPKMGQVIIDAEKATKWLGNGVQPSGTVYNMLVDKGIVEGRKKNVLPKKSPVTDHEAIAKAEEAAAAKLAAEAEAETAETAEETPAEETTEEVVEEAKEETPAEEAPVVEETPTEEVAEEAPVVEEPAKEEAPEEASAEESTQEVVEEAAPEAEETKTEE